MAEQTAWRMHEHDCPFCQCPGDPIVATVAWDELAARWQIVPAGAYAMFPRVVFPRVTKA